MASRPPRPGLVASATRACASAASRRADERVGRAVAPDSSAGGRGAREQTSVEWLGDEIGGVAAGSGQPGDRRHSVPDARVTIAASHGFSTERRDGVARAVQRVMDGRECARFRKQQEEDSIDECERLRESGICRTSKGPAGKHRFEDAERTDDALLQVLPYLVLKRLGFGEQDVTGRRQQCSGAAGHPEGGEAPRVDRVRKPEVDAAGIGVAAYVRDRNERRRHGHHPSKRIGTALIGLIPPARLIDVAQAA